MNSVGTVIFTMNYEKDINVKDIADSGIAAMYEGEKEK